MSKNNLTISIVTPSYNQGSFLEETIQSVLSQKGDFYIDYIIMDGGSTDNSVEIIKKYESLLKNSGEIVELLDLDFYKSNDPDFCWNKCKGISYRWVSEQDEGHYSAINKGFSLAVGEIMAWINSDDKYHSNAFTIVSDIFNNFTEVDWLTGSYTSIDEFGSCFKLSKPFGWSRRLLYTRSIFDNVYIQQESTFWRKKLWFKAGGLDCCFDYAGDFELWLKFTNFAKLYSINALIGAFRFRCANQKSYEGLDCYRAQQMKALKFHFKKNSKIEKCKLICFICLVLVVDKMLLFRSIHRVKTLLELLGGAPKIIKYDFRKKTYYF